MREIIVGKNESGQKLKKFCFYYFKAMPQSFTFRMLRKKNILLNEKKADGDELLKEGDRVQLYFSEETLAGLRNEAEAREKLPKLSDYPWFTRDTVLYEDEDILVLNKPFGILTQKGTAKDRSLNDALLAYLLETGAVTPDSLNTFRPSVSNRLDRNTSGIVAASKSKQGARELFRYFGEKDGRSIQKIYLAVVHGNCTLKGHFDRLNYVKSKNGNQAYVWLRGTKRPPETLRYGEPEQIWTEIYPLAYNRDKDITLILCRLHTGKSHQIRVTMKHYRHPVAGDPKYGDDAKNKRLDPKLTGQLLHSYLLKLPNGTLVCSGVPESIRKYFPDAAKLADARIRKITQG